MRRATRDSAAQFGRAIRARTFADARALHTSRRYPDGIVSVVSDSYDIYNACSKLWGEELKGKVDERLAKTGPPQGRLVVRPDSGEPKDVVVKCLELLGEKFGTSTTSSGHKLLPKHVRVLQGDGISYETVGEILAHMAEKGWATDSVMFGSGGALLQKLNRDTQKCAFKCSELRKADGSVTLVYKDPITDKGKQSKKGRMTVEKGADGKLTTVTEGKGDPAKDVMHEVFRDGVCLNTTTLDEVKALAAIDGK